MSNKRVPRPFGITALLVDYNKTAKPETLAQVRDMFIQHWILNKSTIAGKPYNLYQLSNFLEVDVNYINEYLVKNLLSSRLWNNETQEDVFNAVVGQSISWVIEDRLDIQNQVDILKSSQGNKYKAFVTAELTKALQLKLSSSNTLQSVIKGLHGHTTNIFNQNNLNQETDITLSHEDALEMVNNVMADMSKEKIIEDVSHELVGEDIPEVVATRQIGMKLDKEGLSIKKPELIQAMDDYKGATKEADETHHEIRREIQLRIDSAEDDPEMNIYPT